MVYAHTETKKIKKLTWFMPTPKPKKKKKKAERKKTDGPRKREVEMKSTTTQHIGSEIELQSKKTPKTMIGGF